MCLDRPVCKDQDTMTYSGQEDKTLSIIDVGLSAEVSGQHQAPTDLIPVTHVFLLDYF